MAIVTIITIIESISMLIDAGISIQERNSIDHEFSYDFHPEYYYGGCSFSEHFKDSEHAGHVGGWTKEDDLKIQLETYIESTEEHPKISA